MNQSTPLERSELDVVDLFPWTQPDGLVRLVEPEDRLGEGVGCHSCRLGTDRGDGAGPAVVTAEPLRETAIEP